MADIYTPRNPLDAYPRPPFPGQKQPAPGATAPMDPVPDHGEKTYVGHGRLEGRKALITGGDSGIGRAVAIAFAREGADVAINYLSEDEDARSTAALVEEAGRKAALLNIITTSSIQGFHPSPQLIEYATSKGAIVNFTRGMAQQLAERGIRVNGVAPGPFWTPLQPATAPAEKLESFGEQVPFGRPGQPAELASTFVYLASQESSYTSGETILVNGGEPGH